MTDIFECQQCGYCCHGETTVSLNESDVDRMLLSLKLDREEVSKKYWRITGNTIQMKIVDGRCIFFADGCTIHQGKPWRCTEWPLHPSILTDEANFEAIKNSCPGINQQINYEQFCAGLIALLDSAEK